MDFTDFDKQDFLGYDQGGCKCGGQCESCRNNEFAGYCGCGSHNYSGYSGSSYHNLSIRQDPNAVASEGDPVQPDLPPVEAVSQASVVPMMSIKNKYVKIALIAAVGYLGYKYMLKPIVK